MGKFKTKIWIKPISYYGGKKVKGKEYFYLITDTNDKEEIDTIIEERIQELMDICECHVNENWGVGKSTKTDSNEIGDLIYITKSEIKEKNESKKEISKLNQALKTFKEDEHGELDSNDWVVKEGNIIIGKKGIEIPIIKLWESFSKIDIEEGETADLENGLIHIMGGSYLNVGLADIIIDNGHGNQVAGAFLRKSGKLDLGDMKRTKFISIDLKKLFEKQKFNINNGIKGYDPLKLKDPN